MGSISDWETMRHTAETLDALELAYERHIVSAHRTPERLYEYAKTAVDRGLSVIVAGAGGAAHLPGMAAAMTPPGARGSVESRTLKGVDSLSPSFRCPPACRSQPWRSAGRGGERSALAAAILSDPDVRARWRLPLGPDQESDGDGAPMSITDTRSGSWVVGSWVG